MIHHVKERNDGLFYVCADYGAATQGFSTREEAQDCADVINEVVREIEQDYANEPPPVY